MRDSSDGSLLNIVSIYVIYKVEYSDINILKLSSSAVIGVVSFGVLDVMELSPSNASIIDPCSGDDEF